MAEPTGAAAPGSAPSPEPAQRELLRPEAIRLAERATGRDDAIRRCGEVLVEIGAVEPAYVESMLARERSISTYVGEGVAIPHGTVKGKDTVREDALAVLRFPGGVDWGGQPVSVCMAIAATGDGHTGILGQLAEILLDPDRARTLREATEPAVVTELLAPIGEEISG
ncbi:MAG: PTS sugar transporter subunit IIA [Micromonosporaceae bacterium]